MNKREQKRFVRELIDSIKKDILKNKFNEIPKDWDGKQLRMYVSERFERAVMDHEGNWVKDYKNTLAVTNL